MNDFCVGALLETAHITYSDVNSKTPKTDVRDWNVTYNGDQDEHGAYQPDKDAGFDYSPPDGWEINTASSQPVSYTVKKSLLAVIGKKSVSPSHVTIPCTITGYGGYLDATVTITLRSIGDTTTSVVRKLFLSARQLCCCPLTFTQVGSWVSYEQDLSRFSFQLKPGFMSRQVFAQSRTMALAIRKEMVRSFTSSRRNPAGAVAFTESDSFLVLAADAFKGSRHEGRLAAPLSAVAAIDEKTREQLYRVLLDATVGEVLNSDGAYLARAAGLAPGEVANVKKVLLRWVSARMAEHHR
jgi:hypothetical protein